MAIGAKTYGRLDGLAIGLAAGLLVIAGVVATHAYDWLTWAAPIALALVVGAVFLATRLGRGLVDGAVLRPWLRYLLLAAVVVELGSIAVTPFLVPSVEPLDPINSVQAETPKLVADACGLLGKDVADFEQAVEQKEGPVSEALRVYAGLRVRAKSCDDLTGRLRGLTAKLSDWQAADPEPDIDLPELDDQVDKLPPPVLEVPPPEPAGPVADASPFVPDFVYVPAALVPHSPSDPNTTVEITREEKAGSILDRLLRLFGGGFSFGDTKITTREMLGANMQSKDSEGRSVLEAMAASIPADRPDRLAEFWLQVRKLANDPDTPKDMQQASQAVLVEQGPVPLLCHWVLSWPKDRIGAEVAATIKVDDTLVDASIKNVPSGEWPAIYAAVIECVLQGDRNHFAFYQPALDDLGTRRKAANK